MNSFLNGNVKFYHKPENGTLAVEVYFELPNEQIVGIPKAEYIGEIVREILFCEKKGGGGNEPL